MSLFSLGRTDVWLLGLRPKERRLHQNLPHRLRCATGLASHDIPAASVCIRGARADTREDERIRQGWHDERAWRSAHPSIGSRNAAPARRRRRGVQSAKTPGAGVFESVEILLSVCNNGYSRGPRRRDPALDAACVQARAGPGGQRRANGSARLVHFETDEGRRWSAALFPTA